MSGGDNHHRQNVTKKKEIDKHKLKAIAKLRFKIQEKNHKTNFPLADMHLKPTSIFNMATHTGMAINLTVKPSILHQLEHVP